MLLPNKQSDQYISSFRTIAANVDTAPEKISIDFEQSVVRAMKEVFPNATVQGCNFHLKKAVFSNVGFKGCLPLFNNDENFQVGLELIYALSLVPEPEIAHAWVDVVRPFFTEHFPDSEEVDDFLHYFERNFIGLVRYDGTRRNPMFAYSMWNIHARVMNGDPTTNNAVESWNARWNRSMGTNHNIARVIKGFMNEDSLARAKFHEFVSGGQQSSNPSREARKSYNHDNLVRALEQFTPENLKDFLCEMRNFV